jgi:hypothetical protein
MKSIGYLFAACVLASALSVSAIAGTMHTGAPEPAPTPATAEGEMSTTFNGDIHTGDSDEAAADEVLAEAALSLVQVVLSLL